MRKAYPLELCKSIQYYNTLSTVEWEINKSPYNTKECLKTRITAVCSYLNKETVGKACRRFQRRLEAVFKVNNNYVELISSVFHIFLQFSQIYLFEGWDVSVIYILSHLIDSLPIAHSTCTYMYACVILCLCPCVEVCVCVFLTNTFTNGRCDFFSGVLLDGPVRQWPGRPGVNSRSNHTKDSKNGSWCLLA